MKKNVLILLSKLAIFSFFNFALCTDNDQDQKDEQEQVEATKIKPTQYELKLLEEYKKKDKQAYDQYANECKNKHDFFNKHLSHLGRDVNKIIQGYDCIPYYQWKRNNQTLLDVIKSNNVKKTQKLLDKGDLNINAERYGNSALFLAAANKNLEIMKLLLDKGADSNIKNAHDQTPLFPAAIRGDVDGVKLLLKHGANISDDLKEMITNEEIKKLLDTKK